MMRVTDDQNAEPQASRRGLTPSEIDSQLQCLRNVLEQLAEIKERGDPPTTRVHVLHSDARRIVELLAADPKAAEGEQFTAMREQYTRLYPNSPITAN